MLTFIINLTAKKGHIITLICNSDHIVKISKLVIGLKKKAYELNKLITI
jgi:hypothetical protein